MERINLTFHRLLCPVPRQPDGKVNDDLALYGALNLYSWAKALWLLRSLCQQGAGIAVKLLAAQQGIVEQLPSVRASGCVAIPLQAVGQDVNGFPDVEMEDGDQLIVPQSPATVSGVGNVYSPGSFIFNPPNTISAYLDIAGKGKPHSDLHHAFVLRANGVVAAANNVNGPFTGNRFDRLRPCPGDDIVVPFKIPSGPFVRGLTQRS